MRLVLIACLALSGCSDPKPGEPAPPGSGAPGSVASGSVAPGSAAPGSAAPGSVALVSSAPDSAAPGSAAPGSAAAARAPDPGPKLTRQTPVAEVQEHPALAAEVDGRQVANGAVFLRVAMPALDTLLPDLAADARLVVEAEGRHGFAVPAAEGRQADRPLAWVRFAGTEVPARFTLTWHQPAPAGGKGARQRFTLEGVAQAADNPLIAESFWRAAALWFERRGGRGIERFEPFYAFAAARLELLGETLRPGGDPSLLAQRRRGDVGEAMALYTGWTSIEEALQADRGLRILGNEQDKRTLPLSDVVAVQLPGHPWDALMAANQPPAIEPLAAYAPAEMLYLHFHDLRDMVKLAADAEELLTPVMRTLEEKAGAAHFSDRYERQLAVQRSGLSRTFGHLAAQGVALLASDPFFREGTDVSLLFHIRTQAALEQALATYEAAARQRRPDVTEQTVQIAGQAVRLLSTPDRDIHQLRLILGDVLILSNSQAALARIIEAKEGKRTSLKDSGDFKYFRTLYPFGVEAEDGFLFISDAFVQHVISPRVKILQGRRMAARAAIQAAGFSALLFGWLEGRRPADAAEIIKAGLAAPEDFKDPDGGPIALHPTQGAASATWGRADAQAALIDLPLEQVSPAERDAYDRFRETYQAYWRGFIDPIGVRIDRDEKGGLRLDARMLPLIEQSEYNEIASTVGDVRLSTQRLDDGLRFTFAVAPESRLRSELDSLGRQVIGRRDVGLSWLGDWIMVGVDDRSGIWDLALALGEVPGSKEMDGWRDRNLRREIFSRAPFYVGADIGDGLALAAALTALKTFVETAAPGLVDWKTDGEHRGVPIVKIQEKFEGDGIAAHYAIPNKTLIIALERATLEARIDAVLDGQRPTVTRGPKEAPGQAQAVLAFTPKADGWLGKTVLGLLERGVLNANHTASRAFEVLDRGLAGLPADDAERRALALAWLGQEPINVHGGRFERGPDGLIHHSLYGSETEPKWPEIPVVGSPSAIFLAGLEALQLTIGYEGTTNDRGLHTTVTWQRR